MSNVSSRGTGVLSSITGISDRSFQGISGLRSRSNGSGDDGTQFKFQLPDDSVVNIGNTHQRAAEILFDPTLIGHLESRGIQHLVADAIRKCDATSRNRLYDSIYLCGGNCNIKGFEKRLVSEVKQRVNDKRNKQKIKIRNPKKMNKQMMAFVGGTLVAGNPGFKEMFVTKEEFEEYGARVLFERKMC